MIGDAPRVTSLRCFGKKAWRHEALETPGARMQLRPAVDRQIDDNKARSRQAFIELFAQIHVARGNQLHGEFVKARIVTDKEQRFG